VRTLRVFLGGKYVTSVFCDEKCDRCRWRFACHTSDFKEHIDIEPNSEECQYFLIRDYVEAKDSRLMKCPYCLKLFMITTEQMQGNTKFKCGACGKFNAGSSSADKYDVLIGEPNTKGRYDG